jgi:hypothetical protein
MCITQAFYAALPPLGFVASFWSLDDLILYWLKIGPAQSDGNDGGTWHFGDWEKVAK